MRLKKILYGLRQAPRALYERLSRFLIVQIYVDDIVLRATKDGIFVHQSMYVKNLLKRFGYDNVKMISTLMNQNSELTSDESGKAIDITRYRGMI